MTGWRLTIGIVLLVHGVGHVLGIIPAFADLVEGWNTESWLLKDTLSASTSRNLAVTLWAICVIGFLIAGLALLGVWFPVDWWRPLAVGFGILSLVTLILFWNGLPVLVPNKVGALAVDLIAIVGILFVDWPGNDLLGL